MFDIVFPARGIKGYIPSLERHASQRLREYKQAEQVLANHGLQMLLEAYDPDAEEAWIFHPAYIVRLSASKHDARTYTVQNVTLEKVGCSDPIYTGKVRPQSRIQDIIEMPQVEMWLPFSEVIFRISFISEEWHPHEETDD